MARSILDIIQKKDLTKGQAAAGPDQRSLSETIRARQTGKAQQSRGALGSSTRAQVAQDRAQQQLDIVGQGARLQAEKRGTDLATQAQQIDQAREQGELRRDQIFQALGQQETQILNEYEQGMKRLNTQQGIKDLEQLAFTLRMDNDEYIHELQQTGIRKRLDNDLNFKEEIYAANLRELEDLFGEKLDVKSIMNMNDREFEQWASTKTTNWEITKQESADKAAQTKAVLEGAGNAATAYANEEDRK
jgi:hypothetical protein